MIGIGVEEEQYRRCIGIESRRLVKAGPCAQGSSPRSRTANL